MNMIMMMKMFVTMMTTVMLIDNYYERVRNEEIIN